MTSVYTYNYVPIFDEAGSRVVYAMILAMNVTERRRAEGSGLPQPPPSAPPFAHAPEGALRRSQLKEGLW